MVSHVEKPLLARPITQNYKDGWDAIWGKKEELKKKLPPEPGQTPVMTEVPEDEILPFDRVDELLRTKRNPDQLKEAVSNVLHDPENSKKAKVARGEALTQRKPPSSKFAKTNSDTPTKPQWGDPTIGME